MRTTSGKASHDRVLLGDEHLAAHLAEALAASDPVDRYTHGFHTWPAGLHPDAARALVGLFPGEAILDPFCGGGTTLVEARVAGRRAVGRDLSRVAVRVARTRTATPDDAILTGLRSTARRLAERARAASEPPPSDILKAVEPWYAPHALLELEALRRGVAEAPPELREFLACVFSSILVKVSWRRSDTSAKRVPHRRPPGTTAVLFHKKARELARRMKALREAVPPGTPEADIEVADARRLRLSRPVDLVLTSPPYPSTYDYLPMQHLRRVWLGDHEQIEDEIGPRRSFREGERGARRRWRADTEAWTKASAAALSPGGHLVVVIGDGFTPAGVVDTSAPTEQAAKAAGLLPLARASLERPDFARQATRWEHVFAFRKEPG